MLRRHPRVMVASGQIVTHSAQHFWVARVARGRMRRTEFPKGALGRQLVYSLDPKANMTFELMLQSNPGSHLSDARDEGIVLDVNIERGGITFRVIAMYSKSYPPDDWQDDDVPSVDGFWIQGALYTEDLWIGLYAPWID
jgi:hypothetical protein